jgi:ubiquinone/menaquinone biosynthesis C-methylase UbiE
MLSRVLEPEVMDSQEDAHDYDAMDHREVNRLFVSEFLRAADSRHLMGEILDLGTGTAQIPIELGQRVSSLRTMEGDVAFQVHILAVDLAEHMLELARRNVERAGFANRIALERVDAKELPYSDGRFVAVISNSIVHHIPSPRGVLAEAVRVCAAGGLIFVRDLLRPADDDAVRRIVNTYAAECNQHQRQLFEDSLRAALNLEEIRQLVEPLGFAADTVQATSDRHWTWSARRSK